MRFLCHLSVILRAQLKSDELDDYLRTTEIADPRWWVCLDEETADEWWNQLTDAGWVVGDMPDESNDEAWMSIPPLQQGLRVYKEAEDDLRTYGPFPSHVVTVYKVSVLNVLRMKSEQQSE